MAGWPVMLKELGQAQHHVANGLSGSPYLDGFGTKPGRGDEGVRQQEGVTLSQRAIHLHLQDLATA